MPSDRLYWSVMVLFGLSAIVDGGVTILDGDLSLSTWGAVIAGGLIVASAGAGLLTDADLGGEDRNLDLARVVGIGGAGLYFVFTVAGVI